MSFPLPTFGDSGDLLFRLTRGRSDASRPVVFLLGSALSEKEARIAQRYARLFESLAPGLGRGRVTLYQGIDAFEFFPELASALGLGRLPDERQSLTRAKSAGRRPAEAKPADVSHNPYTPASCRLFYKKRIRKERAQK